MKNVFKRYYGQEYTTIGEFIFGFLLIFLTMPVFVPYWIAKNSYIKINKVHGFSNYEADPKKTGAIFLNVISAFAFVFTFNMTFAPNLMSGKLPLIYNLIPFAFTIVVIPFIYFLSNVRLDYTKNQRKRNKKN